MHGTEAAPRDRVRDHTAPETNRQIRDDTVRRIDAARGDPARIRGLLERLESEWDIERALETLSSTLTLVGVAAALSGRRGWLRLPFVVQTFFLQHALQGWCPPLPVLRRLGFRTQQEIEQERYALRALLHAGGGREKRAGEPASGGEA
jgi:hypothetical protein